MIDRLSSFSSRLIWLKPFLYGMVLLACAVFGYVVIFVDPTSQDLYLIPCVVALLWSFASVFLLSIFPYVPPKPSKEVRSFKRLKIRLVRGFYHVVSWVFVAISASFVWLSVKLLNIWHMDF